MEKDVGRPDADAMCPQRPGLSLGPGVSCRRVWCQGPCFARWAVLFSGGSFVKCPQPSMDKVVVGSKLRSDSDPLGSQQEESSLEGLGVGRGWGLARPPGSRDHVLTPSLCSVLPAWRHRRGSRAACSWEPCTSSWVQLPKSERGGSWATLALHPAARDLCGGASPPGGRGASYPPAGRQPEVPACAAHCCASTGSGAVSSARHCSGTFSGSPSPPKHLAWHRPPYLALRNCLASWLPSSSAPDCLPSHVGRPARALCWTVRAGEGTPLTFQPTPPPLL